MLRIDGPAPPRILHMAFGLVAAAAAAVVFLGVLIGFAPKAEALPSFARQTGQPCGTCHTDFPALTPYGRRFKLLGYTTGGGKYRTTPFSSFGSDDSRAKADKLRGYVKAIDSGNAGQTAESEKEYVPPVAMMAIVGFTHTQAPFQNDPYNANDNTVLSPFSVFWGGAITNDIGAFAQVTYNAPPPGGFSDPFGHTWTWDNTDVRFARTASIGSLDLVYGITANNNPSVQDLWNTTPAWTFPYAASTIAATPGAKTMIEGAFAAHVGGVGAYALLNDNLYLELTAYRTLGFDAQNALGTDPFGAPGLFDGVAPYWRVAFEPTWGRHSFMIGTYGMFFDVHPWVDTSFASWTTATFPESDKFTDIGFDSQYQYQGDNYWLTLRANYIREYMRLDASVIHAGTNPTDRLNSLRLQGSFTYGADNRVVLTAQYFNIWGTSDSGLYGGLTAGSLGLDPSPNSDGYIAEIAYIPFGASQAPGWPWFNARIGLQYTWYDKFEGTTIGAHDHNTVFLHAWFAM